jgi:hypothetical protein
VALMALLLLPSRPHLTLSLSSCSTKKMSSPPVLFSPSTKWLAEVRQEPLLAGIHAARNLALVLWSNFMQSAFHIEGSSQLVLSTVRALLRGFINAGPPPAQQKAITPKFPRKLFQLPHWKVAPTPMMVCLRTHADLVLGACFFATHSCESTKTPRPGRTKRVCMGCLVFPTQSCRVLLLTDLDFLAITACLTIVFEDQKNRKKMDARTR